MNLTRWTENEEVISTIIEIWNKGKRVMGKFEPLAQSKRPRKQPYEILLQLYNNPSVVIKFHLFQDLANMPEVLLKDFQRDSPLLPFLSNALEDLLCRLPRMFLKSKLVEDAVTAYDLTKIDVQKKENQISSEKVCLFLVYSSIVTLLICTS